MKTITLLILLLFLGKQPQSIFPDVGSKNVEETKQIIGKWQRCRTQYIISELEEHNVMSNICMTVVFSERGKGKLLSGDKIISKFKWKIEGELLLISGYFLSDEKEFTLKHYFQDNTEYLELKPEDRNGVQVTHFLAR